ncbi:MAG: tyrosine-protein kinase family protein, partial [Terriglobales bacterium]
AAVRRQQADLETALARAAARQAELHQVLTGFDQTQRQLTARQTAYSGLLGQLSNALARVGDFHPGWQWVDQPRAWPQRQRPRRGELAGAALALGVVLAAALVALFEWHDDRLRFPEAGELGLTVVATWPEAVPARAGLERCAAALLRAQREHDAGVVLITSLEQGAGKTVVASGLAAVLAQSAPVLLLEGNAGRPAVQRGAHASEDAPLAPGMMELLAGRAQVEDVLRAGNSGLPNRICAGQAGLGGLLLPLASGAMAELLTAARQRHDWVIVDGAATSDGPEAELWAGLCDCTLMVARHGASSRRGVRRSCDALEDAGAGSLGLVLTQVPEKVAARVRLGWLGGVQASAAVEIAAWRQRAG